MKNNIFMLFCALVLAAIIIVATTMMHLSKTSEFSRAGDAPADTAPASN